MHILNLTIRIIGSFITLFIAIRLLGKKQFGQLTFIDYAVGLALGTMAGGWAIPMYPAGIFFSPSWDTVRLLKKPGSAPPEYGMAGGKTT